MLKLCLLVIAFLELFQLLLFFIYFEVDLAFKTRKNCIKKQLTSCVVLHIAILLIH